MAPQRRAGTATAASWWQSFRTPRRVMLMALSIAAAMSAATVHVHASGTVASAGARMATRALMASSGNDTLHCADVIEMPNACELVHEYCGHGGSMFDYYGLHYCGLASVPGLSITIQILWLFYLFVALGVAAESFFCPSLNVISTDLKLSENVAGVTLLALGNGAPDLFSTFSAAVQGSFELAFGEVLGAGVFIMTVVVGSVALLKPFTVSRRPFFRDVVFYLVALVFVTLVLNDGRLLLWEAFFLVGWYVVYVITVVVGRRIYLRMKAAKEVNLDGPINQSDEEPVDESKPLLANIPTINYDTSDTPNDPSSPPRGLAEPSEGGFSEADLERKLHDHLDPKMTRRRVPSTLETGDYTDNFGDEAEIEVRPRRVKSITAAIQYASLSPEQIISSAVSVRSSATSPQTRSRATSFSAAHVLTEHNTYGGMLFGDLPQWRQVVDSLFPCTVNWATSTTTEKITGVINMPVYFLLALTVPVAEIPEDEDVPPPWNRYLAAIQFYVSPLVMTLVLGKITATIGGVFPAWALCLILGAVFGTAILLLTSNSLPKYYTLLAWPCFAVSIIWIYVLANELVALISALGTIFGIDETLLGLTVLAWGNSVGDLIANITVARMGFGSMAVAASYAGPMLNMLLGVGLSCAYVIIATGEPFPVELNKQLLVSLLSLFVILVASMIAVPLLKFRFSRAFGAILLVLFTVSTGLNIALSFA